MAVKGNPLRRLFAPVQRAPVDAVEVQDSTWDEWESVVNAMDEPASGGAQARQPAETSARGNEAIPSRRR